VTDGARFHPHLTTGKRHSAVATKIPGEEQYTTTDGLLPLLGRPLKEAFIAYAEPDDTLAFTENNQRLYISLAVLAQLLILATLNYLTYQLYRQLMAALEKRGFVKPEDKPTLYKMMVYFAHRPAAWNDAVVMWWNGQDSSSSSSSKVKVAPVMHQRSSTHSSSSGGGGGSDRDSSAGNAMVTFLNETSPSGNMVERQSRGSSFSSGPGSTIETPISRLLRRQSGGGSSGNSSGSSSGSGEDTPTNKILPPSSQRSSPSLPPRSPEAEPPRRRSSLTTSGGGGGGRKLFHQKHQPVSDDQSRKKCGVPHPPTHPPKQLKTTAIVSPLFVG